MNPDGNEVTAKDQENRTSEKEQIKELLQKTKLEAQQLKDVMWSIEEIMGNKDFINSKNLKINNMLEQTIKNLYWYNKVKWKNFLPNRDVIEKKEKQEQIEKEIERFSRWVVDQGEINESYFHLHRLPKESDLIKVLSSFGIEEVHKLSVLEIGCRDGRWLRKFLLWGALPSNLAGVDVYPQEATSLNSLSNHGIPFIEAFPSKLPFADKKFKIILMFGFLSHVMVDSLRKNIGQELLRVLSDDGIIIVSTLSQEAVSKLQPYLLYTSIGLDLEECTSIFTNCTIDFQSLPQYNLAVIRKAYCKKEETD